MLSPWAKASAAPCFMLPLRSFSQIAAWCSSGARIIRMSAQPAASLFAQHLEAGAFGLLGRGRAGAQRDRDVLHAAVAQVLRMGVALAAVADDGDLLAGDQVQIGVGDRNRLSCCSSCQSSRLPEQGGEFCGWAPASAGATRQFFRPPPARASCRRRRCGRPRPGRARASAR